MDNNEELDKLLAKYSSGTASAEEERFVNQLYDQIQKDRKPLYPEIDYHATKQRIWNKLHPSKKIFNIRTALKYAASIVVLISIASAIFLNYHKNEAQAKLVAIPGKATLTLADGSQVILDNHGTIKNQPGSSVQNLNNRQLLYIADSTIKGNPDAKNIITTPNATQYQVVLPDGTHVWLNSASSLSFPTSFKGLGQRVVNLKGEAYFEVAKDKSHPFIVNSTLQTIQVTGTHFNVSAYPSEPTATTLSEGGVVVTNHNTGKTSTLTPGKKLVTTEKESIVSTVDPTDYTVWKDGYLKFNQTPLDKAIVQLCRHYDVTFQNGSSKLPDKNIDGKFSSTLPLSNIIDAINEVYGTKLTLEERRIINK
uniref:FecR family protein n=1 Tax=Pedobacter schmidteae TaxID=2201271 RepID=UPI000EB1A5D4|nr:FecR domain-containing protein [Pedobacter schmidteae]